MDVDVDGNEEKDREGDDEEESDREIDDEGESDEETDGEVESDVEGDDEGESDEEVDGEEEGEMLTTLRVPRMPRDSCTVHTYSMVPSTSIVRSRVHAAFDGLLGN